MLDSFLIVLVQAGISVIVGVMAIFYRKRLTREFTAKFIQVYGNFFNSKKVFTSKFFNDYLEVGFVVFGICALIFAFFNIVRSI